MSDDGTYVREHYRVPAYLNGRVICNGHPGSIVGFDGQYIRVLIDDARGATNWHPTWRITYFDRLAES